MQSSILHRGKNVFKKFFLRKLNANSAAVIKMLVANEQSLSNNSFKKSEAKMDKVRNYLLTSKKNMFLELLGLWEDCYIIASHISQCKLLKCFPQPCPLNLT